MTAEQASQNPNATNRRLRLPSGLWLARRTLHLLNRFYYDEVRVQGDLPDVDGRGLVIASNHPTNAAILPLMGALVDDAHRLPTRDLRAQRAPHAMAKREFFTRLKGRAMRHYDQVPVDRDNGKMAFKIARTILQNGGTIVIYPEGTLTKNPDGWPTPVTEDEQLAAKLADLHPDSKKYHRVQEEVKSFHFNDRFKGDSLALFASDGALVVPTLTHVDDTGRGSRVLIEFGEPVDYTARTADFSSAEKRAYRKGFTGEVMLRVAEMMATARDEPLPDGIRSRILAG